MSEDKITQETTNKSNESEFATIEEFSKSDREILADVAYWMISKDTITIADLAHRFCVSYNDASAIIALMVKKELITATNSRLFKVIHELPEDLEEILREFYSEKEIDDAMKGLLREDKNEISPTIKVSDHKWYSVESSLPETNTIVLIRVEDRNTVFAETRTEVEYLENLYFASYDGKEWSIVPPYVAYDLSGMTNKDKIVEDNNVVITHWSNATEDEINKWKNRFKLYKTYKRVIFKIWDEDAEKDAYSNLAFAAGLLYDAYVKTKRELSDFRDRLWDAYCTISDLQTVVDNGGKYSSEKE